GVMTGAEVVGLNLHGTEIVVLSSCESGTGTREIGERSADLRHAFHLAGARAVVSSLWNAQDKGARDLMISFTGSLSWENKTRKDEALRKAQLQLIKKHREIAGVAHPFFWAAFTLSGS